jgi:probable rRNA maturation factor
MAKLVLESLARKVKTKKLCKAVYKTLNQKAKFKAELIFLNAEEMQRLNFLQREVDSVTDVLSFPTLDGIKGKILSPKDCVTEMEGSRIFLGSIVLCEEQVKKQAQEFGHSEERERDYLIIHGLMHLFGYDHMDEEDKKEMRAKEKTALSFLGVVDEQ